MRTADFSLITRGAVGFDRIFKTLESIADVSHQGFPPYDIKKVSENEYRVVLAVAGFSASDLSIETQDGALIVKGSRSDTDKADTYLYRGIASRAFERRFSLAEYIEVRGANLKDGLLTIDLLREVPEERRPRTIEIKAA